MRLIRRMSHLKMNGAVSTPAIPKRLIFVYGFKGPEVFHYYMYVAVKSALHHNPDWRAVIFYCHQPLGEFWDQVVDDDKVSVIQVPDFEFFGIARFRHYAHKGDIVRLLALNILGGVYLDIDTVTVSGFDPFRDKPFVMGVQADVVGAAGGLCNAVMMSQPGSAFSTRWLREYRSFNSKGRDKYWDFHSVKLPAMLSYELADEITILPYDRLFWPLWNDLERILLKEGSCSLVPKLKHAYAFHLWNGVTEKALQRITPEFVSTSTSAYASFARRIGL